MALVLNYAGSAVGFRPNSLSVSKKQKTRSTLNVSHHWKDNSYRPTVGQSVELYDGATLIWGGTIDEVTESSLDERYDAGLQHQVRCVGYEQRLTKRLTYNPALNYKIATYVNTPVVTVNTGTDVFTMVNPIPAPPIVNGSPLRFKTSPGGGLPAPLQDGVTYYAINVSGLTFKLAATVGGSAINITTAGSGTVVVIWVTGGYIVRHLLDDFAASEGITAGTIYDGIPLDNIAWDTVPVDSVIQQLATMNSFAYTINPDKSLDFLPASVSSAPFGLTATSAYRKLSVRTTREDKTNDALVRVAWSWAPPVTDTIIGDGSTRKWFLTAPLYQFISATVNGTAVTFAPWLSGTAAYYYLISGFKIEPDPGTTTLAIGDTLEITYLALGSNLVESENITDETSTAAAEGGSGKYTRLWDRSSMIAEDTTSAQVEADNFVAVGAPLGVELAYEVETQKVATASQIKPGQTQNINLPYYSINADYLIDQVDMRDVDGQWLSVSVRALSGAFLDNWVDYYRSVFGLR